MALISRDRALLSTLLLELERLVWIQKEEIEKPERDHADRLKLDGGCQPSLLGENLDLPCIE